MQDAKKQIENQRQAGKELGRGSGEARPAGKRLRTEIKEVSRVQGVPLLQEICTRDEFAFFERAWYDHCLTSFSQDGRCFKNGKYKEIAMPSNEYVERLFGSVLAAGVNRSDILTRLLLEYAKKMDTAIEERKKIHGSLLSVCSARVKEILERRFPAFVENN
jgi:hypothetical protein